MKLPVYTRDGAETGREVELDEAIFGVEPNDHAIWLDVRQIQANARQGTHKTKERSEVSKSRRKLYRQKGTGHARAGDAKSPIRKGGGTIFGPRPHEYRLKVNKKTKRLARRSALTYKAQEGALRIVEDFSLDAPKTRELAGLLSGNEMADRKVLLLTAERDETLYRSGRNIPKFRICPAGEASTLDLLDAQAVLLMEGALDALTDGLKGSARAAAPAASGTPAAKPEADQAETVTEDPQTTSLAGDTDAEPAEENE